MSYEQFIEQIQQRSNFGSRQATEQIVQTTLIILGERLRPVDRAAVAARLPTELAHFICGNKTPETQFECTNADHFVARCNERGQQQQPLEKFQVVCQALAERLDEQARTQLRIQPLKALFAPTVH